MPIDIQSLDRQLAGDQTLADRLARIAASVPGRTTFSSSLGHEDQALLHAIAVAKVEIDVFTLDTGRHFPETLDTIATSQEQYGVRIRVISPERADVETLVARDGINGFRNSIENRKACCNVRKVHPLSRALQGATGWVTGLRRDQSAGRGDVAFAARDSETGLIKLSPLADWSLAELESYLANNAVIVNPLHAKGFPSIGCAPCTRAVHPGESIRAGRWWWEQADTKECGLHNRPSTGITTSDVTTPPPGAAK
jgi:phosphoadenosine phosphosulfate reductase